MSVSRPCHYYNKQHMCIYLENIQTTIHKSRNNRSRYENADAENNMNPDESEKSCMRCT